MNRRARIRLITLLLTPMLYCGCSGRPSAALPPPAEPAQPTVAELPGRVDKLLATHDTVMVRRGIGDVFELVDRLLAIGQQTIDKHYMSEGEPDSADAEA